MLKVENPSVNYGYITALTNISFHVEKGEIIALTGPNGASETTTLGAISGLVPKARGSTPFKGQGIIRMAPDEVVKMSMYHMPEGRKIFPALTVYEDLIAGPLRNPKLSKVRIGELVEGQYTLFPRLRERIGQTGGNPSDGEQQTLAISRGPMIDPDIVILDEPSLGLAPIIVKGIFELIMKIRGVGKTIFLIEQNASMALSVVDRGYALETGKIITEGEGKRLLMDPEVKAAYLGVQRQKER